MECVQGEINLLKKEVKMNDYSKASVEVLGHMFELSPICFTLMLEWKQQIH